jgi:hypothetical protein
MKETRITMPELALVAGTRAALGIGIGLLVANRLTPEERRGAGVALFLVGVLTTIPLAIEIFGRHRSFKLSWEPVQGGRDSRPDVRPQERQPAEFAFG